MSKDMRSSHQVQALKDLCDEYDIGRVLYVFRTNQRDFKNQIKEKMKEMKLFNRAKKLKEAKGWNLLNNVLLKFSKQQTKRLEQAIKNKDEKQTREIVNLLAGGLQAAIKSTIDKKGWKFESINEGVKAQKAYNNIHRARNEFIERYSKLRKQLNTLKTESPNNEILRLEKQLYKFEMAFIEQSSKLLGSVSKIAKSNLTESIAKGKGVQKIFDIQKNGYGKLGGRMVDQLSAGLFTQLYDKAPDNIKEKMNKMNEKRLYIVIGKMWDKFGKNVRLK